MRTIVASLGALFATFFFFSYGTAAPDKPTQLRHDAISSVRTSSAYYGRVNKLSETSGILTVAGKNGVVTFDISNPILMGYRSITDIKEGDFIGVQYDRNGIRIIKKGNENKLLEQEIVGKPQPTHKQSVATTQNNMKKKPSQLKRLEKSDSEIKAFGDIDVNKDGKLSPVELSTMIRDLTMVQFRQYDKNRNGYLDKKEFIYISKTDAERKNE
jgi:hypothetical protein